MQKIIISGHLISSIGLKRSGNEDNYLIGHTINESALPDCEETIDAQNRTDSRQWAAVFDGMGSGGRGQRASLLAAREMQKGSARVNEDSSEAEIEELAKQAFLNANEKIVEERRNSTILGTTATLMCFCENRAKLFHLGDSRAYLYRSGRLYQLSKDQTLAALKIDAGIYEPDSPQVYKDRHALTEYIGADETMTSIRPTESPWITLKAMDRILLCSDGLYHQCPDEKIREILASGIEPEELAQKLVRQAFAQGGRDNITGMVLSIRNCEAKTGGYADGN